MPPKRKPEAAWNPWFFTCDPPAGNNYLAITPVNATIATSLVWRKLESPIGSLYCEVQFADEIQNGQTRKKVAQAFWQAIARGNVLQVLQDHTKTGLFKRRVFVYAGYQGAFGSLAWKLASRMQAGAALAVHGLGGRNAVPCECCEKGWQAVRAGPDQVACFVPFWECVSLPNEFSNACSNCLYHETQVQCCYRNKDFYQEFGYMGRVKGTKERRASGGGVPSSIPNNISSIDSTQFFRSDLMKLIKDQYKGLSKKERKSPGILDGSIWVQDSIDWKTEGDDEDSD
ncbi:uncharacterized protein ColSpa_04482 [Colletotrichum spaethianum]|uniref:Uncharacterized protein n=1 Tax=Colletotrichum spaethianum TaxID=700344 RepID=A0AA37P5P0_9PEZI|nr:uncharacterized protein ColSpa_04482 [Colletotrichum spaethianum]GKT44301.1 hypothetical protein ColSpa_04482 [Colletotrichum spaethianum]